MNRRAAFARCLLALLVAGARPSALAQQSAEEENPATIADSWRPPTLTITRYTENWSGLAVPAARTGRWTERFKYIPLDAAGSAYLTTGLELRLRNENYEGLQWGDAPTPDQGYLWLRALPYADLHVGRFRVFVQPIASFASGVEPAASPVDRTRVDMLQAFADYVIDLGSGSRFRLEAGRQLVSLGSERLVGTRYGPNTPQPFDGGRVLFDHGALTASLMYLVPVNAGSDSFDDRGSRTRALWGAYATRWLAPDHHARLDAYYLILHDDQARFQQGAGRETRHTLGLRSAGRTKALHWDAEAMFQFGRFAGSDIRAWSVAMQIGKTFSELPLAPDLSMNVDIVSGDRDPARGALQAFNPLFPKGKYFGELSPIGPRNIIDLHPTLTLDLGRGVALGLAGMAYWRQSKGDGVYDIPGQLLRAGAAGDARFIGKQAELRLAWRATPELTLSGSASHFSAGAFLKDTGRHEAIDMAALEANFRF